MVHARTTVHFLAAALVAVVGVSPCAGAPPAGSTAVADIAYQSTQLRWEPRIAYAYAHLRLVGPNNLVVERSFGAGKPAFDLASVPNGLPDGQYRYEVTLGRIPSESLRAAIAGNAFRADGTASNPALSAEVAALVATASGSFIVSGGQIMTPQAAEQASLNMARSALRNPGAVGPNDTVIADDQIVQGSLCVGLDCVNGEVFGFSTIKLKENNTRITFDDTSATAGFPTHDWQLTANDSASGGLNKFSIEDLSAATVPFTVLGSAPSNSIFVASTGRVGFRTSTPVLDLHVMTGDTPGLRLEQSGASGFTPQTWDVAGNEANFFVRDLTAGSRLPLRIRPGAPTSSIDIGASGNVGIGTDAPQMALHVLRSSGDTILRIEQTGGAVPSRWDIKNNAVTGRLTFSDDPANTRIPFKINVGAQDNLLRVGVNGLNTVDINGNLLVTGTITPDYVFDSSYHLESIDEHAAFMWQNRHLPAVAPAQVNEEGKGIVDIGARSQGLLEELEKAHIYIGQLHAGLKALRDDAAIREAALADLRQEVEGIKKALAKDSTGLR